MNTKIDTEVGEVVDSPANELLEVYLNAPQGPQAAIDRIIELEMRLEDLSRASEIAEYSGNYQMMRGFRESADLALVNKITIDRPIPTEPMKITVLTNGNDAAA